MGREKGNCRFCQKSDVWVNDEHVYPKWLGKKIIKNMESAQIQIDRGMGPYAPEVAHSINITARCACQHDCNNGWMKHLEDEARPFILAMAVKGLSSLLDANRRRLLARWLVKTAMTYEFTKHQGEPYFSDQERNQVRTGHTPPTSECHVWAGVYFGKTPAGLTSQYTRRVGAQSRAPGYVFTLRAGYMFFQMLAHRPAEESEPQVPRFGLLPEGLLLPLWPLSEPDVLLQWPPPIALSDELRTSFEERFWSPQARRRLEEGRWRGVRVRPPTE